MDDKAFTAFVKTNAVRMDLETLQWMKAAAELQRRHDEIAEAKKAGKIEVASRLERRYEGAIVAVRL
jgi:hypothetical protein